MESVDELLEMKHLVEKRAKFNLDNPQITQLLNHYSKLIEVGAWEFELLNDKFDVGVVNNTIFTPVNYWDHSNIVLLKEASEFCHCEYLVNRPWLLHHPVIGVRDSKDILPLLNTPIGHDMSENWLSIASYSGKRADITNMSCLFNGSWTVGSLEVIHHNGVIYMPLLPISVVSEIKGLMSTWGTLKWATYDELR